MAIYSQDVLEDVRSGNDIVDVVSRYVQLKQKGRDFFGLCPFHKENSPSFSVSPDKQMYYCFGCGAGGNVFGFVMQIENFGFVDAVKFLADRIHYTLPEGNLTEDYKKNLELKNIIFEMHTKTARFYYDTLLSEKGVQASAYLDERKVSVGARRKFGLGFADSERDSTFKFLLDEGYDIDIILQSGLVIQSKRGDYYDRFMNRLMFPIFDAQNRVVGFGGRIIGAGEPKYLNSPDTPIFDKSKNLYSINYARVEKKDEIILVEGYMDVIALYQAGFRNVVASLGTAFNTEHVKVMKKYCSGVVLLFDSDEAGEKAALRAIPILKSGGLNVRVLQLSGQGSDSSKQAKDPDDYIKKYGRDAFAEALQSAVPYPMFQVFCVRKKYNLSDTNEKIKFTHEASAIVAELDNAIERDVYINEISRYASVSADAVKTEVNKLVTKGVDSIVVPTYRNKPSVVANKTATKGVDEARRNVLYIASTRRDLCIGMTEFLQAEEFVVQVYTRFFEIVSKKHLANEPVYVADIISYFEESEEQQIVTAIFAVRFEYDNETDLLMALNQQIKMVKTAFIDFKLSDSDDIELISKMVQAKKNLKNVYFG